MLPKKNNALRIGEQQFGWLLIAHKNNGDQKEMAQYFLNAKRKKNYKHNPKWSENTLQEWMKMR